MHILGFTTPEVKFSKKMFLIKDFIVLTLFLATNTYNHTWWPPLDQCANFIKDRINKYYLFTIEIFHYLMLTVCILPLPYSFFWGYYDNLLPTTIYVLRLNDRIENLADWRLSTTPPAITESGPLAK